MNSYFEWLEWYLVDVPLRITFYFFVSYLFCALILIRLIRNRTAAGSATTGIRNSLVKKKYGNSTGQRIHKLDSLHSYINS